MENQRLKELAGLLTEKKDMPAAKGKWTPPKDVMDMSASALVKMLCDADCKKAMSRMKMLMKSKACKDADEKCKAKMEKAKDMLTTKLMAMKEDLESVARRSGILFEKKKHDMDMDGMSDPEMDMGDSDDSMSDDDSDADDKPAKGKATKKDGKGEDEEETLPKIVSKIAKKAVGKDVEALETLIMKVYQAGHKDGMKECKDEMEGGSDKKKKPMKEEHGMYTVMNNAEKTSAKVSAADNASGPAMDHDEDKKFDMSKPKMDSMPSMEMVKKKMVSVHTTEEAAKKEAAKRNAEVTGKPDAKKYDVACVVCCK